MSRLAVSMKNRRPSEAPSTRDLGGEEFVRAFNDCRAELVSTLYYILGHHDDAQDAAQETFIKCWRTRSTLGDVRNMRGWIFRVGMNAAKDLQRNAWRRKAKMMGDAMPPEELGAPSPVEILEEREEQGRLRAALIDLRADEKEVFLLRQNGELTFEEIAEMRRTPIGTVKTQMRSALQKLRKVLQESPTPPRE